MTIGPMLRAMTVTAESPDGRVWARVSDYTRVEIGFRPWTFERYDEPALAHQLARLGVRTWVAWSRERTELYRRSLNLSREEAHQAERTDDPHRRRYEAELDAIEADGVSARGTVRVHTVGMMQWQVEIVPGTLRRLGEQPFVTELHTVFESLRRDREIKIITLKGDYFDLGVPRRWLDLMNELRAINRRGV